MSNPGNPFSQILIEKQPHLFFGQENLLVTLIQGINTQEPSSFAINGPKTFGKTTLLYFLKHPDGALKRYSQVIANKSLTEGSRILFLYVDFYNVSGNQMLTRLYEWAAADQQIAERAGGLINQSSARSENIKETLKNLFEGLRELGLRLVILMDHFDKTFETMDYDTDVFLRALTFKQPFIIMTERNLTQIRRDASRISSPLISIVQPKQLGVLTPSEARQMITQPLGQHIRFSEAEIEFILNASGKQPFLIAVIGEFFYTLHCQYSEVKDFMGGSGFAEQVSNRLIALPAVVEVFTWFWKDLDAAEQQALSIIASHPADIGSIESRIISQLNQKGLLQFNITSGTSEIYSDLFCLFVLQQTPQTKRHDVDQIVNALSDNAIDRKLYQYLVENPDRLLTFEELLEAVWGDPKASKKGLEAAIHRLRTRIKDVEGQDRNYIQNVRKKGFVYRVN